MRLIVKNLKVLLRRRCQGLLLLLLCQLLLLLLLLLLLCQLMLLLSVDRSVSNPMEKAQKKTSQDPAQKDHPPNAKKKQIREAEEPDAYEDVPTENVLSQEGIKRYK
jgi:hypothetical protein